MQEQLELRNEMSLVRSRGLANAMVLGERVEKLSDWREHVRAHPLPIALATATLAYWLVPAKRQPYPPARSATDVVSSNPEKGVRGNNLPNEDNDVKAGMLSGLSGAAMGFVGSLIGNAVRSYVSEQVQTLITIRGNHAESQQRKTPFSRF